VVFSMARNRQVRRIIIETLWERGPMTKGQMYSYIENNHKLLKEPTEHSLSSIMNKNSQVIPVGFEIAVTESGNKASHVLFDINREMIKNGKELIMTMPIAILLEKERKGIGRCPLCARMRILTSNEVCLMCEKERR